MLLYNSHKIRSILHRSYGNDPGGGGGTLNFHTYVGSGSASTVYQKEISSLKGTPKKYGHIRHTQKVLSYPPKIYSMCTFTFH